MTSSIDVEILEDVEYTVIPIDSNGEPLGEPITERGVSVRVTGLEDLPDRVRRIGQSPQRADRLPNRRGDQVTWALDLAEWGRLVRVDGPQDLAVTVAELQDTARAVRVYARLVAERRVHLVESLRQAAEYRQIVPGHDAAAWAVRRHFESLVRRALREGLEVADIQEITGLADEREVLRAGSIYEPADLETERRRRRPVLMGIADVAERVNVAASTIRQYRANKAAGLPPADDVISGTPVWEWPTIEEWVGYRRGSGWAAGTTADLSGRRS